MAAFVPAGCVIVSDPREAKALAVGLAHVRRHLVANGHEWPEHLAALQLLLAEVADDRAAVVDALASGPVSGTRNRVRNGAELGVEAVERNTVMEWWSTQQVAEALGVTASRVKVLARRLGGVQDRPGGVWRFPSDVVAAEQRRRSAA